MYSTPIPSRYWEQELRDNLSVDFFPTPSDSGHYIVSRYLPDEGKKAIGQVYVEVEGDEIRYICCNRKGREIFPSTTDFNLVAMRYERYARQLTLQEKAKQNQKQIPSKTNINLKKQNTMKTLSKKQRVNQFRFTEYEIPTPEGHKITVSDSYGNLHGRIFKTMNDETKKTEYIAFDHTGHIMAKSNRLWEVKNVFINNREQLLEAAHQRRIASKEQSKEVASEKLQAKQVTKADERKSEMENLRGEKIGRGKQNNKALEEVQTKMSERGDEKSNGQVNEAGNNNADENQNQQEEREEELEDLRDSQDDDRGDTNMER